MVYYVCPLPVSFLTLCLVQNDAVILLKMFLVSWSTSLFFWMICGAQVLTVCGLQLGYKRQTVNENGQNEEMWCVMHVSCPLSYTKEPLKVNALQFAIMLSTLLMNFSMLYSIKNVAENCATIYCWELLFFLSLHKFIITCLYCREWDLWSSSCLICQRMSIIENASWSMHVKQVQAPVWGVC